MTWAKLSDDWADRPAILTVSRSARLLHVEALLWSNGQNQGGAIPARALRRLTDAEDAEADAAELVESGAWEATENGWQLVDSADEQPSVEEIERKREQNRERQERNRKHRAGDHSLCTQYCRQKKDVTRDVTRDKRVNNGPSVPDPTRPDPSRPLGRDEGEDGGRADAPSARAPGATRPVQTKDKPGPWDHLDNQPDPAPEPAPAASFPGRGEDEKLSDYLRRVNLTPFVLVEDGDEGEQAGGEPA